MTKNKRYKQFIKEGVIELITAKQLREVLNNIKGKRRQQARALVITMYYTGARPAEVLELKAKDITKDKSFIVINMPAKKRGLPRPIHLQYFRPLVRELWNYAITSFPGAFLFYDFKGYYPRKVINKKGEEKINIETTAKLRYWFKKWFGDINPYFLRHNRFSQLASQGVSDRHLKFIKGSRTVESINYYTHLSVKSAREMAKYIK